MKTIQELLEQIDKSCAELKEAISDLHQPFAGMIDTDAIEQVEDERNKDHYYDEKI